MEISERRKRWTKNNTLTPEKLTLAHHVLDEIREGQVTGKVNDDLTALALAQAYLSRQ